MSDAKAQVSQKHTARFNLPPWMLPTRMPVVAPVATKGSASCAWGGSLRHVSKALCFTDVMKGLRKSTSTWTAAQGKPH